jgi:hypothetical protein
MNDVLGQEPEDAAISALRRIADALENIAEELRLKNRSDGVFGQ